MKSIRRGGNSDVSPSGNGCVERLASAGWWLHLQRCAQCRHIGCCDSSPSQHATRRFHAAGHPVIASFEPGESWFYSYETRQAVHGETLAPPGWHPEDQAVPGPAGRVPAGWETRLH